MRGELETLCKSCGLCCDGSLFGLVPLDREEVAVARRHRLHVLDDGRGFEQPCTALVERTCAIYDERPRACHAFVCRLYERHRREGGPLAPRIAAVQRVRELIAQIQDAALAPADLEELQKRLEEDFARAVTRDQE